MPKLNAVAMVVLTLGVLGGTGYVVLRRPGGVQEPAVSRNLLRNLSDRDPDVSEEAATALLSMGPRAIGALQEATLSENRLLAERARKLLAQLTPAPVPPAPPVEPVLPDKVELLEFVLESRGGQARAADLGALWVQLRNDGPAPVLVALAAALDHPKLAIFEVEDGEGHKTEAPADVVPLKPAGLQDIVPVRPHETSMLFQGGPGLVLAVSKPGTYRIRFAYDATAGSDYRRLVHASPDGTLLPPLRLVSNTVTVTVAD